MVRGACCSPCACRIVASGKPMKAPAIRARAVVLPRGRRPSDSQTPARLQTPTPAVRFPGAAADREYPRPGEGRCRELLRSTRRSCGAVPAPRSVKMLLSGNGQHTAPRYPAYLMPRSISHEELLAAAEAAVARVGGRGVLGPVSKGAKVLILTADDQDAETMSVIEEALRDAGAVSVRVVTWSSLGLPTGEYSAAEGWRELSKERLDSVIASGERVA